MFGFDTAATYYEQHPVWVNSLLSGGVLMAIIGYFVARMKGNGCWGCGLGCLLGPVGIIIAALLPDRRI